MAVTITIPNFTTPDGADATTGWSGSDAPALYTNFYREASGCLGMGASASDEDNQRTITSTDFSNVTVFGWMLNGSPGTTAAVGFGIQIGDGTNDRVYAVGGSDNYGHFVNGWSGFRLNCANLPTTHRNTLGTGAPTLTTITRIGYGMNYAISAFGKIDNVFYDVIRYITNGNPALVIAGGGVGTEGTWGDIAADDESSADGKAYGVCRRLSPGSDAYEVTFGIQFGAATGNTYFKDANFQLILAGTGMAAGAMDVDLLAGTGTQQFTLEDGVIVGIGTVSNWDLSGDFDTTQFNRITCSDLGTIAFPASGGTLRESVDCIFNNCGQVTIGTNFTFTGHTFNGTTDANGALLFDNAADDTNVSGLAFVSDGTGHAIYITATGTYDLNNFDFTGYSTASPGTNSTPSSGSTDAVIYNNSGGAVTINISGGSGAITVRNGASATTTVNNNVTVTFTGMKDNSEVRVYNASSGAEIAGIEDATAGTTDARTFAWSAGAGASVDYVIHNWEAGVPVYQTIRVNAFTVPSVNTSIPIQQVLERNAA